jgi:hypothetical protein
MADFWRDAEGARIFGVRINGTEISGGVDVYKAAQGKSTAYELTVPITVTDNMIVIELYNSLNDTKHEPILSGIVVDGTISSDNPGIAHHHSVHPSIQSSGTMVCVRGVHAGDRLVASNLFGQVVRSIDIDSRQELFDLECPDGFYLVRHFRNGELINQAQVVIK